MRNVFRNTLFVGLFCLVMSGAASAVQIEYDFRHKPNGYGDPLYYEENGLGVRVSALPDDQRVVVDTDWGLGIYAGGNDNYQVDGAPSNKAESLIFTFDEVVELSSVLFTKVGRDRYGRDGFTLDVDGKEGLHRDLGSNRYDDNGQVWFPTKDYNLVGNVFDFGTRYYYDDYYIGKIKIHRRVETPEPQALALLLLGLLGLRVATKKRI